MLFILANILFLGGYFIGISNTAIVNTGKIQTELTNVKTEFKQINVNLLWQVWDKINTDYLVSDVDNKELFYASVKGLVNGLNDPYTNFLTPSEVAEYNKANKGELEGIGVTLRQEGQYVVIESVIDGFPASKIGLLANDLILEVDGLSVENKSPGEVASVVRGTAGTKVQLTIYRTTTKTNSNYEVIREKIDIDNITMGEYRDGIQVIKIYKFTESSPEIFNRMWDEIATKVKAKNPKGIIIDLRGNPGGYVSGVEYILGDFITKGKVIFYEEDRDGHKKEHIINRDGKFLDVPLTVIVNNGSASASEIMSAAFQDHARAKIVGQTTVGKGVEQKLLNLDDGSQLQLVFSRWLTPNGRNIDREHPITPDFLLDDYTEQTNKAFELLK